MTICELNSYREYINGLCSGDGKFGIWDMKSTSPRTLCLGYTSNKQMIHVYIHNTPSGDSFFAIHVHGNECGGFRQTTHIYKTVSISDLKKMKIVKLFTEFTDLSFLKGVFDYLGHTTYPLVSFYDWFDKGCAKNGYPPPLVLYISEDIISSSSSDKYSGTVC